MLLGSQFISFVSLFSFVLEIENGVLDGLDEFLKRSFGHHVEFSKVK